MAAALPRSDGRWLLHRRPAHKAHGGLWEFPGGKVELSENPRQALARELMEELDILVEPADLEPAGLADELAIAGNSGIVILLYICRAWQGEPRAMEGGEVGWFRPGEIARLACPPMDSMLSTQLFGFESHTKDRGSD